MTTHCGLLEVSCNLCLQLQQLWQYPLYSQSILVNSMVTSPKVLKRLKASEHIPETAPGEVQILQCSLKQLSSIPSFSYLFPIQSHFCCTPDFVSCKWLFLVYACPSEQCNDLLFLLDAWLFPRNQLISVLLSLSALNLLSQSTWPHLATPGPSSIPHKGKDGRN